MEKPGLSQSEGLGQERFVPVRLEGNEVGVVLTREEVLLLLDVLDVVAGMRLLQTWNADEMDGLGSAYRKLIEATIEEDEAEQ